jgi:CheY-like chemotaxis protein
MDLELPGIDGLTLATRLKDSPETSGVVIVAVTAFAMKGDEQRVYESGCDGYISKPIDTRKFVDQVRGYLDESPHR